MSRDHRLLIHGGEITGFEMLRSVKWEAHRGLLSSVPTMLRHLREDGINDPTLFLRKDRAMELLAGDLLRSFFNNQNKLYDMTVKKTREICAWRTPHVLACAIRNVVEFSAQPLIPSETALRLLAVSGSLRRASIEKKIELVTEIIEEMSAWRFEILAALVSFLKDCTSPKADLARELGPLMLLRYGVSLAPPASRGKKVPEIVREQNQINDEMAASEAFRVLIDECPSIFGVVSGYDPSRAVHQRFHYEEKSIADEEKMSVASSVPNLYEGITGPTPSGGRRTRTKKASSFYNIIARTASNVSRDSGSSAEPLTPMALLKTPSQDRSAPSRRSAETPNKTMGPGSNKRPAAAAAASTRQAEEQGWQERRPPPLVMSKSSGNSEAGFAMDSPLLTQNKVVQSTANSFIKTQNSFGSQSGGSPLIRTQNSFSQNQGNPLIKTQTSFNQSSRPATPTALLSARKNLLSDIQSGNGSGLLLRSASPASIAEEPSNSAPEPVSMLSAPVVLQRPVAIYPQNPPQRQEVRSPAQVPPPPEATSLPQETSRVVNDADGPTIFEQELMKDHAAPPSEGQPAHKFEDELKKRATRASSAKKSVMIDVEALRSEEENAIKQEQEEAAAAQAGVAAAAAAEASSKSSKTKPKEPRPLTKPRHSFIPRITSPARKAESVSDKKQVDEKVENETPEVSPSATPAETQRDVESPTPAQEEVEEKQEDPAPVKPPKPSTGSSTGTSFEEKLAAKKSELEKQVSETSSPIQTKGKSFDQVLAERKSQVDSKPPPPAYPNPNRTAQTQQYKPPPPPGAKQQAQRPSVASVPIPQDGNTSVSATAPPNPRPKPIPPRPSLTLQMMDVSRRLSSVEVPPSPENGSGPDVPMEDKLANLRALLKTSGSASTMAPVPEASPPPLVEDPNKRRVPPPPDHPPPAGQTRMDKPGGMQIVGDWRTEWSPQYKAQFWVNILNGSKQWEHPQRERSRSTKQREEQAKHFAPVVTAVTVKMPEQRKTLSEAKVESSTRAVGASTTPNLTTIVRQNSNSEAQKNLHKSYRRASLQTEDFQAQNRAQFDEADAMVIAAARAAGEDIAECVFDFTPVDANNKSEMAIRVGDKLRIYEKGPDGWWGGVKIADGRQRGLFPEAYVKLI